MKKFPALLFVLVCCICAKVSAQNEYNVLSFSTNEMYNKYLIHKIYAQYENRDAFFAGDITESEARAYGEKAKAGYLEILGRMPKRTPLNAVVTATHDLGACIMENIVYESSPNWHVTVNLYRPKAPGKYPAIIMLCGHSSVGKVSGGQPQGAWYAANGIITMVIDPVSQGERNQLIDAMGNQQAKGGTTEHTLLHMNSLLVGESTVKDELWDNIRGLDYLETRADVDKDRLGCFGFSGGGTQSMYVLAFDDRVKAAGIGGFFSQRRRSFEIIGGSDGCQHIPGEGEKELEIADFAAIFAPKPLVIVGGHYCFVDWIGAERGYKELQKLYAAYGVKDNVFNYFGDDGHAFPLDKQTVVIDWFVKHLVGKNAPAVPMPEFTAVPAADMLCTDSGNLSQYLPDEVLIPKRNAEIWDEFAAVRQSFAKKSAADQKAILEKTAKIYAPKPVRPEARGPIDKDGYTIEKWILHAEDETPLPCLVFVPKNLPARPDVVVMAYESGKAEIARAAEKPEILALGGKIVILTDLRGIGETEDKPSRNDAKFYNREYTNAVTAMHIGESLAAQRTRDLITILNYIEQEPRLRSAQSVTIEATGKCTVPALHAAVYDNRVTALNLMTPVQSWKRIIDSPTMWDPAGYIIPNAALAYDLPDLVEALQRRKVDVTMQNL